MVCTAVWCRLFGTQSDMDFDLVGLLRKTMEHARIRFAITNRSSVQNACRGHAFCGGAVFANTHYAC